jgi:hypothetical protein
MSDQHPNPQIPAFHSPFQYRLSQFSERFNAAGPVKIVAIGSSSTAGEGGRTLARNGHGAMSDLSP